MTTGPAWTRLLHPRHRPVQPRRHRPQHPGHRPRPRRRRRHHHRPPRRTKALRERRPPRHRHKLRGPLRAPGRRHDHHRVTDGAARYPARPERPDEEVPGGSFPPATPPAASASPNLVLDDNVSGAWNLSPKSPCHFLTLGPVLLERMVPTGSDISVAVRGEMVAAYHAEYDRYGAAIVGSVVGEQASESARLPVSQRSDDVKYAVVSGRAG
jgi:hypothetical protein